MIYLVVQYHQHQWPLEDSMPVRAYTRDSSLVATFTGELVRRLLEHHMSLAVLQEGVRRAVERPQLHRALPRFILDSRERETLREQRRKPRRRA